MLSLAAAQSGIDEPPATPPLTPGLRARRGVDGRFVARSARASTAFAFVDGVEANSGASAPLPHQPVLPPAPTPTPPPPAAPRFVMPPTLPFAQQPLVPPRRAAWAVGPIAAAATTAGAASTGPGGVYLAATDDVADVDSASHASAFATAASAFGLLDGVHVNSPVFARRQLAGTPSSVPFLPGFEAVAAAAVGSPACGYPLHGARQQSADATPRTAREQLAAVWRVVSCAMARRFHRLLQAHVSSSSFSQYPFHNITGNWTTRRVARCWGA